MLSLSHISKDDILLLILSYRNLYVFDLDGSLLPIFMWTCLPEFLNDDKLRSLPYFTAPLLLFPSRFENCGGCFSPTLTWTFSFLGPCCLPCFLLNSDATPRGLHCVWTPVLGGPGLELTGLTSRWPCARGPHCSPRASHHALRWSVGFSSFTFTTCPIAACFLPYRHQYQAGCWWTALICKDSGTCGDTLSPNFAVCYPWVFQFAV